MPGVSEWMSVSGVDGGVGATLAMLDKESRLYGPLKLWGLLTLERLSQGGEVGEDELGDVGEVGLTLFAVLSRGVGVIWWRCEEMCAAQ